MCNKLENAKQIIDKYCKYARCGIFNCNNWIGDDTYTIYSSDGLVIDICYDHEYFEVFGLSDEEFAELKNYYNSKE